METFVILGIPAVILIIIGIACFLVGQKYEDSYNVGYADAVFVRKETVKPVRGPKREVLIYEYTVGKRTYTKKLDPAYNKAPNEFDTVRILYLKSLPNIAYFSFIGDNLQISKNIKGGLFGFCLLAAVMLGLGIMILFL